MNKLYMHQTTYDYIKNHPDMVNIPAKRMFDGYNLSFFGHELIINNLLKPTRKKWIFPTNEPFVIYDENDEEWCRYAGIGYESDRAVTVGEILVTERGLQMIPMEPTFPSRSTVFNPDHVRFKVSYNDTRLLCGGYY